MTYPEDDFVLVTQAELRKIASVAGRAAFTYDFARAGDPALDGRRKIPCAMWCEWVKEGWADALDRD